MQAFDYARPATVAEAVALLARHGGQARVLAGGTDLVVGLRHATEAPRVVVDIKGLTDLPAGVSESGGVVRIGATAVMTDLCRHPLIRARFPALVEAMSVVGSVQIRNRATLAGNVCHASPAADTAPALLVHDARLVIAGPGGERRMALERVPARPGPHRAWTGRDRDGGGTPGPGPAAGDRVRPDDPPPRRGPGHYQPVLRRGLPAA